MENFKIAGILLVISATLFIIASIIGLMFIISAYYFTGFDTIEGTIDTTGLAGLMVLAAMMATPIALIFGIIQLISGIRCSEAKNKGLSIFGCILGMLTLIFIGSIIFAIPGIISLIALILIIQSNDEFEKRENEQNLQ